MQNRRGFIGSLAALLGSTKLVLGNRELSTKEDTKQTAKKIRNYRFLVRYSHPEGSIGWYYEWHTGSIDACNYDQAAKLFSDSMFRVFPEWNELRLLIRAEHDSPEGCVFYLVNRKTGIVSSENFLNLYRNYYRYVKSLKF